MPSEHPKPLKPSELTQKNLKIALSAFRNGETGALTIGETKPEAVLVSFERFNQLTKLEQNVAFDQTVASRTQELDSGAETVDFDEIDQG